MDEDIEVTTSLNAVAEHLETLKSRDVDPLVLRCIENLETVTRILAKKAGIEFD